MSGTVNDQANGLGDDDARPGADDQQQQPAAPPQAQQPPAEAEAAPDLDSDMAELLAARAAVEAEQRGESGAAEQQDDGQQPAQPPAQAAPAPATPPAAQPQGQQQRPRVVPYDRFADVNRRLQEERDRRQYLEGALAATRGQPGAAPAAPDGQQPPAPPPAPVDPIEAQIAEQRQQLAQMAERFDSGEMSMAEFERQRGQAEDRIATLRVQQLRQGQQAAPESLADQAIEQAHLNNLYSRYPYAASLNEQQAISLSALARQELELEGRPVGTSRADTLRLREKVAELSNTWGPKWGLQPSATTQQQPPQPSTPPRAQPPLSTAAQARQRAMATAAGLPPDPGSMGAAATSGEFTDAQIATMDDEAIGALPAHVRHRIMHQRA